MDYIDEKNDNPDSSTKQIALHDIVSSEKNSNDGDLLNQASGSQGPNEPPKPAIRQRLQASSVQQVTRSSSASAGIFSEQRLVSQQQRQQVTEISDSGARGFQSPPFGPFQRTNTRPLSIDPSNLASATYHQASSFSQQRKIETSSQFVTTTSSSQQQQASSSVRQRFSTSSLESSGASISAQLAPTSAGQFSSAGQLAASSQRTTTQRTQVTLSRSVGSATRVSSSSSISGQAIGSRETEALLEQVGRSGWASSALRLSESRSTVTTASQSARRVVSSEFAAGSIVGGTSVEGSSGGIRKSPSSLVQFESSKSSSLSAATSTTSETFETATSTSSASQRVSTGSGTISSQLFKNSISSGAAAEASAGPISSLVGRSSALDTNVTVAKSGQVIVPGLTLGSDTGDTSVVGGTRFGQKSAPSASPNESFGTPVNSSAAPQSAVSKAIWTTTQAEREIASRYLDKSFRSKSPLVVTSLLESQVSSEQTHSASSISTIKEEGEASSGEPARPKTPAATISAPTTTIDPAMTAETMSPAAKVEDASYFAKSVGQTIKSDAASDHSREATTFKTIVSESEPKPETTTTPIDGVATNCNQSSESTTATTDTPEPMKGQEAPLESGDPSDATGTDSEAGITLAQDEETSAGQQKVEEEIVSTTPKTNLRAASLDAATIRQEEPGVTTASANGAHQPSASGHSLVAGAPGSWGSGMDASDERASLPIISAKTSPNYRAVATNSKGSTYLPLPTEMPPQRPYPKKVFFIILNEFCERFSFYGLRTVLVLYLRGALGFSDANSTIAFHLFTALCFMTPIMGAILADSIWGKYKTILYLSIVYFCGEFVLVLSSIFWDHGGFSISGTILGLILIGLGTGGIKPCVCALGGDQFYQHETTWRETFFSVFYGAINLGAMASMFATPILRSNFQCVNRTDCFPYAFGLPCALMFVAIVVFVAAKKRYYLVPLPENNVLVAFCQCIWLAIRRKFSGRKLPEAPIDLPINSLAAHKTYDNDTSSSNLSVSSNDEGGSAPKGTNKANLLLTNFPPSEELSAQKMLSYQNGGKLTLSTEGNLQSTERDVDRNHWLYLASDRFDTKTIEDFRSVLSLLFLLLPIPIYWSLFDQQSSLWTLQATRMDGRIWGTNFVLEPDQMSVLNPLLLLLSIAVFQLAIYPSLARCNVMQSSIQRITVGGLFLALAFVASALIELRIQQHLPASGPQTREASLLLVNGLSDCSMDEPKISYVQVPSNESIVPSALTGANPVKLEPVSVDQMGPLTSKGLTVLTTSNLTGPIDHYHITFKLVDGRTTSGHSNSSHAAADQASSLPAPPAAMARCPFSQTMEHQLSVGPLAGKAVKLLYVEQGNGKLALRTFDDSLDLPAAGKARVRLLYEFFGSAVVASKHQFYLDRASLSGAKTRPSALEFHTTTRGGQVLVSQFMDVDVSAKGESMLLRTDNKLVGTNNTLYRIPLEAGTRNLIIVHQNNASNFEVKHQILQDNQYRVSVLYQLIPYTLLSVSEVLLSITLMEFSYAMAPKSMKTVLMASVSLTVSIGNLLTVAIESLHIFSDPVADFVFYAVIMVLAMVVFATMGYYHKPRRLHND